GNFSRAIATPQFKKNFISFFVPGGHLMIGLCFIFLFMTTSYGFVQRFALADFGRAWILFESRKKLEARKMLVNRADSQKSAARFVSPLLI
ncbi:MAG: hypothetical protein Q8L72_12555, partial [Moraxellaceae bacterium]|nr:hypothetical protein [Moraxellaceae bacterium]